MADGNRPRWPYPYLLALINGLESIFHANICTATPWPLGKPECIFPSPITQPHAIIALAVYLPSALKTACCIDDLPPAVRHHDLGFPPLSTEASSVSIEIPCEGNMRPSHRKKACSSNPEIPNQSPGVSRRGYCIVKCERSGSFV